MGGPIESGAQRLSRWVFPVAGTLGVAGTVSVGVGAYVEHGNHFLGTANEQVIYDATKSVLQPIVSLFALEAHPAENIDGTAMALTGEILLASAVVLILVGFALKSIKPRPSPPTDFDHF